MRQFCDSHGSQSPWTYANLEAAFMWIRNLKESCELVEDTEPLEWISGMLQNEPDDRPFISTVQQDILRSKNMHSFICSDCLTNTWNKFHPSDPPEPLSGTRIPPLARDGSSSSVNKPSDKDGIVTAEILGLIDRPRKEVKQGINAQKRWVPLCSSNLRRY